MPLNRDVSIGNIVTWTIIILGLVASFTKLQGDVGVARATAEQATIRAESLRDRVAELNVAIAEIKERTKAIDSKVDEIRRYQRLASDN